MPSNFKSLIFGSYETNGTIFKFVSYTLQQI